MSQPQLNLLRGVCCTIHGFVGSGFMMAYRFFGFLTSFTSL